MCKEQLASLVVVEDRGCGRAGPERIEPIKSIRAVDQHVHQAESIEESRACRALATLAQGEARVFDQDSWQVILHKVCHVMTSSRKKTVQKPERGSRIFSPPHIKFR